jgi:hypothetical protein
MLSDFQKATRIYRRIDGSYRIVTPRKTVLVTEPEWIKFIDAYIETRIKIKARDNPDGHGIKVSDLPG